MENFDDKPNAIIADDELLSEKDNKKINEATTPDDERIDDIPSANEQGRDTNSNKKLKTLAIFIGAILVAIAGIVMASSRYSENKAKRKAQEAEQIAQDQKKMADGTVDIASDQAKIESSKMYDIPPPADATTDEQVDATRTPPAVTPRQDEPYTPPPNPVPTSQYDSTVSGRDYALPAPVPVQTYIPNPTLFDEEDEKPAPAPQPQPQPQVQAQAPKAETGVLVDVYGAKAVLANANQENAPTRKTVETATRRGNTSLMLIKGTNIPCVLKTKIDSTYQGFTVCQVSKDVYSSNGKTLLIERGSSVFGEQNIQIKHGQARVYVIWQKIETPKGVSVNVDSPATGQLGEMGVEARVNNHFGKRFGGAIMLSLIQDTISNASTHLQKKQSENQTTIDNTSSTMQDMATKALENSINIPPTAIVHQGTLINILVNRDMDFTSVYGVERVY
jgi:hypothetical protein